MDLAVKEQKNSAREQNKLSQKDKVVKLLKSIETGAEDALNYVNRGKFVQHNLLITNSVEDFNESMKVLATYPHPPKINVKRAFTDGDYVFTHTEYNYLGEKIGFDIFRFEDGLIVEHWDNLQLKPSIYNPSGNSMIDGETEVVDKDKTEENRAIISEFANRILIGGDFENIGNYFNGDNYIQHNPLIGNGLSTFNSAYMQMVKDGITMKFDKLHRVFAEGNFVLLISEGRYGKNGGVATSFYDLFRIKDKKIAEHWDVIEQIAPQDSRKNINEKFGFKG